MGSVRSRDDKLFVDFRHRGVRYRELTQLHDTPFNRALLKDRLAKIEAEAVLGPADAAQIPEPQPTRSGPQSLPGPASATANFAEFAGRLLPILEVEWRTTHRYVQRMTLEKYLTPAFGHKALDSISRADILDFRARLARMPGKKSKEGMTPSTVNHVMSLLNIVMSEAALQFCFPNPMAGVKCLKVPKSQVDPFTVAEIRLILSSVREEFRDYYLTRFFTGMRTAEIDGLKWNHVDFERQEILIREVLVNGRVEYTKNDGSQREVRMSGPVFDAFRRQHERTKHLGDYVFCNREGAPLDRNNITKRVWYPLLLRLGLKKRTPYQTRHTAATLWLASGENPEWIARQMGHSSTDMLFRVYSRYVPNLTRMDGSAFERLIDSAIMPTPSDT